MSSRHALRGLRVGPVLTALSFMTAMCVVSSPGPTMAATPPFVGQPSNWAVTTPVVLSPFSTVGPISCATARWCLAIGSGSWVWNGTTWLSGPALLSGPPKGLATTTSLTCVSREECFAVGYEQAIAPSGPGQDTTPLQPLIERFTGSSWVTETFPNAAVLGKVNASLGAVACASATRCVALGSEGPFTDEVSGGGFQEPSPNKLVAAEWNGTNWHLVTGVHSDPGRFYTVNDASCVSATSCIAVGTDISARVYGRGKWQPLIEVWDGNTWSKESPRAWGRFRLHGTSFTNASKGFYGVSCRPDGRCMLVGNVSGSRPCPLSNPDCVSATGDYYGQAPTYPMFQTVDRGRWFEPEIDTRYDNHLMNLLSVSCPSDRTCVAVGYDSGLATIQHLLVEIWNGQRWSMAPGASDSGVLVQNVACPTQALCLAPGQEYPGNPSDHDNGQAIVEQGS